MTGAIEFLKACQELCHKRKTCNGCPIGAACDELCYELPMVMSDEQIAELVWQVMAESREANK